VINSSPFLNTGLIIENFNLSEKTPKERDLLQRYVIVNMIKGSLTFRISVGISS